MTAQRTRSPEHRRLIEFVDNEPEWAMPALLNFLERLTDTLAECTGESSEASVQAWIDERAEAEAAHLVGSAPS